MSVVQIEPTKDYPVPYDLAEEKPTTRIKEVEVAGNTAELQESLGAKLEVTEEDAEREKQLLQVLGKVLKILELKLLI